MTDAEPQTDKRPYLDIKYITPEDGTQLGVTFNVTVQVNVAGSRCPLADIPAAFRKPDLRREFQAWASKTFPNADSSIGIRSEPIYRKPDDRSSGVTHFELRLQINRKP